MGNKISRDIYSLYIIFNNIINIISLLKLLSSHIILYNIKWVGYLYSFFLRLIFNPVTSSIIITIIYNIFIIEIIGVEININNINIIFSSNNIIIISNTSLFINKIKFKLEIEL